MIKMLGMRKGNDALNYLRLAGCTLPPLTAEMPFSYSFTWQGVGIDGLVLDLKKGENVIELPTPELSNNCLLLVSLSPALLGEHTASLPIHVWGKEAVAAGAVKLTIKAKDATSYTGPLATYHLLSDR